MEPGGEVRVQTTATSWKVHVGNKHGLQPAFPAGWERGARGIKGRLLQQVHCLREVWARSLQRGGWWLLDEAGWV